MPEQQENHLILWDSSLYRKHIMATDKIKFVYYSSNSIAIGETTEYHKIYKKETNAKVIDEKMFNFLKQFAIRTEKDAYRDIIWYSLGSKGSA